MILDLLVVGSGGNGQTYFMKFCQNNNIKTNCWNDTDGLKHINHPKLINNKYKIKKCIFIYNHPYKSILSHFRRNWWYTQINKLGDPYKLPKNIQNIEDYYKLVIRSKKDLFGIEVQFDNWFNNHTVVDFPILFLDFNEILNNCEVINNFLQKSLNYKKFIIIDRNSDNIKKSNKKAKKIYDKLYRKIKYKLTNYRIKF